MTLEPHSGSRFPGYTTVELQDNGDEDILKEAWEEEEEDLAKTSNLEYKNSRLDRIKNCLDDIDDILSQSKKKTEVVARKSDFEKVKNQVWEKIEHARQMLDVIVNNPKKNVEASRKNNDKMDECIKDCRKLLSSLEIEIFKDNAETLKDIIVRDRKILWDVAELQVDENFDNASPMAMWVIALSRIEKFSELSSRRDATMAELTSFLGISLANTQDKKDIELLYKIMDTKQDGIITVVEFYIFRKALLMFLKQCKCLKIMKKQIDFIDYRHNPNRFHHNSRNDEGTAGYSDFGQSKKLGLARGLLENRIAERNKKGEAYQPIECSEQEMAFIKRSAQWEQQLNDDLDDILKRVIKVNVIAQEINLELQLQDSLIEETLYMVDKVDEEINTGISRLQEVLDATGGIGTWIPRFILAVLLFSLISYGVGNVYNDSDDEARRNLFIDVHTFAAKRIFGED